MRLLNVYKETITDGVGLRYSIYLSGCSHHCPGCHNPESWDAEAGIPFSSSVLADIIREIRANPLLDGITVSGGDPFYHPEELFGLLASLKEQTKMSIWCYTGYTIEYILAHEEYARCLQYIDVLVDGRFVENLVDPTLNFRGSSNQRIFKIPNEGEISLSTITELYR